jgi:hypothetical protein
MPPLSMDHLSVLGAVMSDVTSVLGPRTYSYFLYLGLSQLTNHRIKKATKEESFDPELVAAVEAKLRDLDVESDVLT